MRKTRIIATIGPATLEKAIFDQTIDAGVDFIRINTSYGDRDQYQKILNLLESKNQNDKVKIILDVKSDEYFDFASFNNLDIVAVSFCESKEDIQNTREKLKNCAIWGKIESIKGVNNCDEIIEVADVIMIARGDLKKIYGIENVPSIQEFLVKRIKEKNKLFCVATEMMLSMVNHPVPTIAEASDIANAVHQGAHAVMLSEETAIGQYPSQAVFMMDKIIQKTEEWCLNKS